VYENYMERQQGSNVFKKFSISTSNDKAVVMGYRNSLFFVFIIDCLVCLVFLVQAILMITITRPVFPLLASLREGDA